MKTPRQKIGNPKRRLAISFPFFAWSGLWTASPLYAQANAAVGTVERLNGAVSAGAATSAMRSLRQGDNVAEGELVQTGDAAEVVLKMVDGAVIALRPRSSLRLQTYQFSSQQPAQSQVWLQLVQGGLRAITGLISKTVPQQVRFTTSTATIGIRGTDFEIEHVEAGNAQASEGTYLQVREGATTLTNSQGASIPVLANQTAFSPQNLLATANSFGLLNRVPPVFRVGTFDNLLVNLQNEGMQRLQQELNRRLPSQLQQVVPGLRNLFNR
jgi:FecR protein